MIFINPLHLKTNLPNEDMGRIANISNGTKAPLGPLNYYRTSCVSRERLCSSSLFPLWPPTYEHLNQRNLQICILKGKVTPKNSLVTAECWSAMLSTQPSLVERV